MERGENPTLLQVPVCPPVLTLTCSLSCSPPQFPALNTNILQLIFFSRYNLAMIQPELFLAELVMEQPPAEGIPVQRERVSPLFQTALACHTVLAAATYHRKT